MKKKFQNIKIRQVMYKRSTMNRFFIIFLLQLFPLILTAQEWMVPEEKKGKLSPFHFNEEARKTGERLYVLNCKSCHGIPGKANFINLVPPPGDPATEKIQHNSDGEIFYKVTTGRGPMPSFKNALSSTDIWNVISYLRTFNSKYTQSVMPEIKSAAYPGAIINISLALSSKRDSVFVKLAAISTKSSVPVKNAGLKLLIRRTFGMLSVDEEKATDPEGVASFKLPGGLPGDTAGNVYFSVRFTDEDKFGAITKDTILNAGIITIPESLVQNRAIWNNVRKAPVWVILSYGFGVLGVWGFIFYVLLKLRDIFIVGELLGNKSNKSEPDINVT
jgi:hypothetical protein